VVANRVLPPQARSEYFDKWIGIQAGHLQEARQSFEPLPFFQARLFDREMVGLTLLDDFAGEVFGDKDPTTVFFQGERPVEVKKEGKGYALYIRMPFAEKEDLQVWTHGEDLVVSVKNQRRNILLPRTLASRRLLGAALVEGRLRVAFGEREDHGR
jgi:arsenite/tail-anchored protein-transporting ATPase